MTTTLTHFNGHCMAAFFNYLEGQGTPLTTKDRGLLGLFWELSGPQIDLALALYDGEPNDLTRRILLAMAPEQVKARFPDRALPDWIRDIQYLIKGMATFMQSGIQVDPNLTSHLKLTHIWAIEMLRGHRQLLDQVPAQHVKKTVLERWHQEACWRFCEISPGFIRPLCVHHDLFDFNQQFHDHLMQDIRFGSVERYVIQSIRPELLSLAQLKLLNCKQEGFDALYYLVDNREAMMLNVEDHRSALLDLLHLTCRVGYTDQSLNRLADNPTLQKYLNDVVNDSFVSRLIETAPKPLRNMPPILFSSPQVSWLSRGRVINANLIRASSNDNEQPAPHRFIQDTLEGLRLAGETTAFLNLVAESPGGNLALLRLLTGYNQREMGRSGKWIKDSLLLELLKPQNLDLFVGNGQTPSVADCMPAWLDICNTDLKLDTKALRAQHLKQMERALKAHPDADERAVQATLEDAAQEIL